jgi:16S rRNA G966 N2-methylase RsmD
MAKKGPAPKRGSKGYAHDVNAMEAALSDALRPPAGRPSSLLDTRVIYCGDCLEQLRKLPERCIDLIYIDPPFNSNRTVEELGEVFWGETKEKRAFEDRHASNVRSASR